MTYHPRDRGAPAPRVPTPVVGQPPVTARSLPRVVCDAEGARWVVREPGWAQASAMGAPAAGASATLTFTRADERRTCAGCPDAWPALGNVALGALLPPPVG